METTEKKNQFELSRAEKKDLEPVREMIQELADFEKHSSGPQLTEEDLVHDSGLEGNGPGCCHIYILKYLELAADSQSSVSIGYAICYFGYSTWQGKTYCLEDLYVRPAYRRLGAGAFMFRKLAGKAKEYNCKRLDFHVLSWNPARQFYDKMGAVDLTEMEQWHYYRLDEEQIKQLATYQ